MLEYLLIGLENLVQPFNLFILFAALIIGFFGGALPGISGTMLVIIMLPITYGLEPIPAFILLVTIYSASVFSGLISAILFRTPGTPEAVVTTFDGYPMAQKGKAGEALGIGIFSSAAGGLIGSIFLIFFTPLLASFALRFSSPEFFALAFLGLTVVASLSQGALSKGFIGVGLGLLLATVGLDPLAGAQRFTFGSVNLMSGIDLIPVLIGLFAISEVLKQGTLSSSTFGMEEKKFKMKIFTMEMFNKIKNVIAGSSILGVIIGVLPGVGATTASMISYSEAARWSKDKGKFGTGVPAGIAAPESANNAGAMGAMVPLLALGIPGSATTAVILGAFILQGLEPGPTLMKDSPDLVYTLFVSLFFLNIIVLAFAKPFIKIFTKIMNIPYSYLGALILILCVIGTYAVRNSIMDVWIMLIGGLIGYYLDKAKFPMATIVLGIVLGPIAEENFRRSLQMANDNISVFFTRPISLSLLILSFLSIIIPWILQKRKNKKQLDS